MEPVPRFSPLYLQSPIALNLSPSNEPSGIPLRPLLGIEELGNLSSISTLPRTSPSTWRQIAHLLLWFILLLLDYQFLSYLSDLLTRPRGHLAATQNQTPSRALINPFTSETSQTSCILAI